MCTLSWENSELCYYSTSWIISCFLQVWKNFLRRAGNICGASWTCWSEGLGNILVCYTCQGRIASCAHLWWCAVSHCVIEVTKDNQACWLACSRREGTALHRLSNLGVTKLPSLAQSLFFFCRGKETIGCSRKLSLPPAWSGNFTIGVASALQLSVNLVAGHSPTNLKVVSFSRNCLTFLWSFALGKSVQGYCS